MDSMYSNSDQTAPGKMCDELATRSIKEMTEYIILIKETACYKILVT